ncbi:MAG TPA: RHS repeat-associated core domain-containing protein [Gammaproteobacteria bacterium]|nr:RHS repeat-associated core domain-containing protein [Gammaproteobacteria bacterium]
MREIHKPFGELATLTDAEFHTTTINYDARGYKSSLADPNMGTWTYEFNVYGQLKRQRAPITASPNWTTTLTYDEAGRIKTRAETEGTTTWVYYTTGTGAKGNVNTITGPGHALKYTYGTAHGLPTQIRYTLDGTNYFYNMTYDGQARLNVLTYPTSTSSYRFKVDYDYDIWGNMTVAKDGNTPSTVYYSVSEADALGREVLVDLGNGLDEYHEYDRASGNLMQIETGPSLSATVQNLSFTYDEVGNVLTRTNANIGKTETFVYDNVNRVVTSQVSGLALVGISYSAAGSIIWKSDIGTYTYTGGSCGGGPFAVKTANGDSFCYDANGRMTSRGGSAITWFSYDLPNVINNGTQSATFSYGVDRARYKQIRKTGSTVNATILYIGELVEKETAGSTVTWRHYVGARGRTIAQVNRVNTTNTVQYLHRDQQRSVVEVTSSTGAIVQSLAFDAWGLRRNASNWSPLATPFGGTQPTERGYTGHEHLDNVELVHMNGRVQDPVLGLFVSADPFVQAPYHSQSHNRYAYVWNNPVSLVDPSGFCEEGIIYFRLGGGFGVTELVPYGVPSIVQSAPCPPQPNLLPNYVPGGGETPPSEPPPEDPDHGQPGLNPGLDTDQGMWRSWDWWSQIADRAAWEDAAANLRRQMELERLMDDEAYSELLTQKFGGLFGGGVTNLRAVVRGRVVVAQPIRLHHAWPKYLFGPTKQDLVPLTKSLHDAFHSGLDKIWPRQWGIEYYEALSPAGRQQVARDLAAYTKAFDAKHGTQLYDAMLRNGFPGP